MAMSIFLALLSGSRTAFISSLLVVFFHSMLCLRARDRWAMLLPAPIFGGCRVDIGIKSFIEWTG